MNCKTIVTYLTYILKRKYNTTTFFLYIMDKPAYDAFPLWGCSSGLVDTLGPRSDWLARCQYTVTG